MRNLKNPAVSPLALAAIFGGVALLLGALITRQFHTRLGHDQVSYLFEAQRVLSGFELYGSRVTETNPPVIVWFSMPVVLFAHWIHTAPEAVFRAMVLLMVFGSTAWCVSILRRSAIGRNPLSLGLAGCAILIADFGIGGFDFGQREHLLILLLLPYLLAAATSVVSTLSLAERCALGIAAGISIWFKPYEVIVILALELFLAARAKSLRRIVAPELLTTVVTSSIILLFVRTLTPLYSSTILPLLFDTYWALGTMSTLALALSLKSYMLQALVVFAVWYFFRRSLHDAPASLALLICSLAASVAFDIQHTDWRYHAYPHLAILWVSMGYLAADLLLPSFDRLMNNSPLIRRIALAAGCVILALLGAVAIHRRIMFPASGKTGLDYLLAQERPHETVFVFSTGVDAVASVYTARLEWGGRFAHLWMMPAILQNELGPTGPPAPFKRLSAERLAYLAALQRSQTTEDLTYWKPTVVFVDHCDAKNPCQGIEGKNFDFIAWFQQSPEFAAVWSHYQRQPGTDAYDIYKLVP